MPRLPAPPLVVLLVGDRAYAEPDPFGAEPVTLTSLLRPDGTPDPDGWEPVPTVVARLHATLDADALDDPDREHTALLYRQEELSRVLYDALACSFGIPVPGMVPS